MKGRFQLPSLIFYGISGIAVLICIVSFINALSFLNKPFPGFLINKFLTLGSMSRIEWSGIKAGLKLNDRIVAANGQPIHEGGTVIALARRVPLETPIEYTVESKGETRTALVPTAMFSLTDFLLVFLVPFIGGLTLFLLGFIVYLLKPNVRTSWVFLFFCLVVGIYMFTAFEIQSTHVFSLINFPIIPLMPATLFHLGSIFPQKKALLTRYPKVEYIIYIPALIIAFIFGLHLFTFSKIYGREGWQWVLMAREMAGKANQLFLVSCIIGMILIVFHSMHKTSSAAIRQRARMIVFGVTIAFLPTGAIMLAVYFLKVTFPWNFLVFFVICFPAAIAYSIIRHNLFDADAIIRRTVGYVVVTAVVVGAYVVVSVFLNVFLGRYDIAQSRAFPIVFTLAIILIFNPLRNRIQSLVDKIFFRKEYDFGEIVSRIGDTITSSLDLGQILKQIMKTFTDDMFIDTSSVMLLSSARTEYQVYLADGERKKEVERIILGRDKPLMQVIEKEKKELTKYDVLEDPRYKSICEDCSRDFETLHASLIFPLVFQNEVTGLISLGEKKSGKFYNREDIDFFHTLARQGAVAIENARLFQENLEKQRMEEELNIARDLQMSMLPGTCPQIEGFTIAATSIPAREVGGDFFDFIEMGEEKLGLVVGDVTGKSVSGALVMSASRSVFRMLSEEMLTVGDIMIRANKRIKKDIKSGMFVALLYALLDSSARILKLCSAGQTQPIHFSSKTGEARLMQTEGDRFPLGILDEADYRETKLELASGDKIVFYTDGIVEAMNEKEEIFGFERLLEVVQEARSMNAESLLKEILDKVSGFSGGVAQHDDLTVIVVALE